MYSLDFIKHKDFLDKCISGQVSLFTGAGFSLGATVNGENILSTSGLIDALLEELLQISDSKQIARLKQKSFQNICQYCIENVTEEVFNDFIVSKFKDTIPSDFHHQYADVKWKEIYTVNIDDIIEFVYRNKSTRLQVINTKKQPSNDIGIGTLKYYKLHGDVNNKSEGFIFSKKQYLQPLVNQYYSFPHLKFAENLYNHTFCFIGTSLDEIDIDKYLYHYRKFDPGMLPKNKIYYVSRTIHPEDIKSLESRNIICIQETAENFIKKLLQYKGEQGIRIVDRRVPEEEMKEIGFLYLNDYITNKFDTTEIQKHKPINFYLGYNAKWLDIVSGADAILDDTLELIKSIKNSSGFQLYSLIGKSGNGKSTSLKRVLYTFAQDQDFIVFEHLNFQNLNTLTVDNFLEYLSKQTKKIIIGLDNAAWSLSFINDIYEKLNQNKNIIFIITSRYPEFYREKRFTTGIPNRIIYLDNSLTLANSKKIVEVLDAKGYLGKLASYINNQERAEALLSSANSKKDLFSCLIETTKGKGFFERIHNDINLIMREDNTAKTLLYLLAIFDRFASLPLSLSLFANIHDGQRIDIVSTINKVSDFLSQTTLNIDEEGISTRIKLRGAYITDYIIEDIRKHADHEEILGLITKVLSYVGSIYSLNKSKRRDYYTILVHTLLSSRNYMNHLQIKQRKLFDDFYNSIKDSFKDYSLFWLSYARMEMKLNDLNSAFIHLQQADALSPYNSYQIEHAYGQWYMLNAKTYKNVNDAKEEFEKGEQIMLRQMLAKRDAYPIHTYIVEFISFYSKFNLELSTSKLKQIIEYINEARSAFPDHVIVLIIWKKFYLFLKKQKQANIMKLTLEEKVLMNKIDINKSAEEQYGLLKA